MAKNSFASFAIAFGIPTLWSCSVDCSWSPAVSPILMSDGGEASLTGSLDGLTITASELAGKDAGRETGSE